MPYFRSYQIIFLHTYIDSPVFSMKIYSGFLFLLLIQPFSFVRINDDCFEWNQQTLFSEQMLLNEIPGVGGPCQRVSKSCNVIEFLK
jgi:hypothetical protein